MFSEVTQGQPREKQGFQGGYTDRMIRTQHWDDKKYLLLNFQYFVNLNLNRANFYHDWWTNGNNCLFCRHTPDQLGQWVAQTWDNFVIAFVFILPHISALSVHFCIAQRPKYTHHMYRLHPKILFVLCILNFRKKPGVLWNKTNLWDLLKKQKLEQRRTKKLKLAKACKRQQPREIR